MKRSHKQIKNSYKSFFVFEIQMIENLVKIAKGDYLIILVI
jgi:hypothetical protein